MTSAEGTMKLRQHPAPDDRHRPPARPGWSRTVPAAVVAVALAAVTIGLATAPDKAPRRLTTSATAPAPPAAPPAPPATTVPPAAPDAAPVAAAGGAREKPVATTTATPATTVAPAAPAPAPDRSRPAGMAYRPGAVWPETLTELDRLQAAADRGQQPWRNDPVEVAKAYLVERGLPTPGMGAYRATNGDAGNVDYTVAGRGGRVSVQRLLNGTIWFVTGSRSDTLPGVRLKRQGASVAVVVQSGADGTLSARAKRPGGEWGTAQTRPVFAGASWSANVGAGDLSGEVVVQVRFEGRAGLAETFLEPGTQGASYSALDSESRLRVDGLGPVRIGMPLEEARAGSGLPMTYGEAGVCVGYETDGSPAGVSFTAVEGSQRLDFLSVAEPTIATVSGIRVGSTVAEVRRTYGARLGGSVQDGWGKLVFRADDPSLEKVALAFLISDGKVTGMWAGLRSVVEQDEICA